MKWQITKLTKPTNFQGLGNFGTRQIDLETPVIINEKDEILAIPGLIGGQSTCSENNSLNLILEVANFDGEMVARSAAKTNYRSDASKIWAGQVRSALPDLFQVHLSEILNLWQLENEKINPKTDQDNEQENGNGNEGNSTKEIKNSSNGAKLWQIQPVLKWELVGESKNQGLKIDFDYLASRLDGQNVEYWKPILIKKMNLVGRFEMETGLWFGNVFYGNITTLEQLLIELVRLIGFANLTPQNLTFQNNSQNQDYREFILKQKIKKLAVKNGFTEVITRPFISQKHAELTIENDENTAEKVLNPYNSSLPFLRNSLLSSLLETVSENLVRGWKNPLIFEQNQILKNGKSTEMFGAVAIQNEPYLLTTLIDELTIKLGFDRALTTFEKNQNPKIGQITIFTLAKNSLEIQNSQQNQIKLFQINNITKKEFGIPLNKVVWYLEMELDSKWQISGYNQYFDESLFPSVERDYSVQTSKTWQQITKIIQNVERDFELQIWPVSYFLPQDAEKEPSKNSKISFKVKLQSKTQTLSKNQVENWEQIMLKNLE